MGQENQWTVWNPFGKPIDHLSGEQRAEMEKARAWAYYINGGRGPGEPYHFDYETWLRTQQQSRARSG